MDKPRRPAPKSPTTIDRLIGKRIRAEREAAGLGQVALAAELGITFQQIQKYENGKNRVAAARLFEICRILKVPIATMFEERLSKEVAAR